jgi:hypothetical protein
MLLCTTPPAVISQTALRDVLRTLLTADEIELLAAYLYDERTAGELAAELYAPRTTISDRIGRAIGKLQKAGVKINRPGRGRHRRRHVQPIYVAPEALSRMQHSTREDGIITGHWIDTPEFAE